MASVDPKLVPSCGTCKYFVVSEKDIGQCQRHPPIGVTWPYVHFPARKVDSPPCGEYAQK